MFHFLFLLIFLTNTYANEKVIDAKEFLRGLEYRLSGTGDFPTSLSNRVCSENVIDVYYLDLKKHNLSQLTSTFGNSRNASFMDFTDASSFVYDVFFSQGFIKKIKVSDPYQMLMRNDEFLPQIYKEIGDVIIEKAQGGTRAVGIYGWEGRKRICLKQWPEVPTAEIAAYNLFKGLYPTVCSEDIPLPMSEVILMNKQVFSVLRFIMQRNSILPLRAIQYCRFWG